MTDERTFYCIDMGINIGEGASCHDDACPYADGCEILQNSNGR